MKRLIPVKLKIILWLLVVSVLIGCSEKSDKSTAPADKGTIKFVNRTTSYSLTWIELNSDGNLLETGETVDPGGSWSVHVDPGQYTYHVTGIDSNNVVAIWDNDGNLIFIEKGETMVIKLNE